MNAVLAWACVYAFYDEEYAALLCCEDSASLFKKEVNPESGSAVVLVIKMDVALIPGSRPIVECITANN
ncbi:hypothetical protein KDH_66820 [Dictyobacter sp. S3.2.2.5]|uniref:Uncharacterized protein n=1 Tax=Dictyobacter halimunensis TaxID=3026934 RepID=A0ABQ6G4Z1_9CHLR|nr:hypothetical protein KDH_66820 [Dictyobacter sp. S3.2.2.5]